MASVDWRAVETAGGWVVRPVRWQLVASTASLLVGSALAASVAALLSADPGGSGRGWVLGWALLSTLGLAFAFRNLRRLVTREPLVACDREALHLPGVGRVRWREISAIRVDEVGRGRSAKTLIGIYLHEPRAVLDRAGLRRRLEGRIEVASSRAPLAIHPFKLPMELWELASRLEARRQAALREEARRADGTAARAP